MVSVDSMEDFRVLYFVESVVQIGVKDFFLKSRARTFLFVRYKMRCQLTEIYGDPQSFLDKDMGRDLWHVTS